MIIWNYKLCLQMLEYFGCPSILERSFIMQRRRYDMTLLLIIQANLAIEHYGYDARFRYPEQEQALAEDIHVYPSEYFDCPGYSSMKNVVCIHMRFGAWMSSNQPDYLPHGNYSISFKFCNFLRRIKSNIDEILVSKLKIAFTRNIRSKYIHDDVF